MRIHISTLDSPPVASLPMEVVERKGIGHPDTLCDALVEEFSRSLSRFYLERFGFILHHNVDKALLFGGAARPAFGGGTVLAPIELYLAGRATREFRGVQVPVEELAIESTRRWLKENLHAFDPERYVRIHCLVRPSSAALVGLFLQSQQTGVAYSNDTSCAARYAPLDPLERLVLQLERELNAPATKRAFPEIGEDIKVMGVRQDGAVRLTLACALIDRHVSDLAGYFAKRSRVADFAEETARRLYGQACEVEVNAADGETPDSIYLTVTGTSAEAGNNGEVGRGNRANGLITPYRPMSLEAVAGKNPVTHVGKLYNLLAYGIAERVSRIGYPVGEPHGVDLRLRLVPNTRLMVGVMGSAEPAMSSEFEQKAYALGKATAEQGLTLITGACPGLPYACAHGARDAGGLSIGISPGLSLDEHVHKYLSPSDAFDVIIYTGSGLMGREVTNIRSSDIVIILGGRSGTLGEFAIAYDEGKLIGVLQGTGGIADHLPEIVKSFGDKDTGARLLYQSDPATLIRSLVQACTGGHFRRPSCFCEEVNASGG